VLAAVLTSAACDGEPTAPTTGESDFSRHLRLARQQMLRHLYESAEAELDRCGRIDPDHPDLLFHRARLALFGHGRSNDLQTATALLERVVQADPDSVKAHRLLFELSVRGGDREQATLHKVAVERVLGDLGRLEMALVARHLGGKKLSLSFDESELVGKSPQLRELARAFSMLERHGEYAPTDAVPLLERIMTDHPQLALLRYHYARTLIEQEIRVNFSPRPDLPPMSSMVIADYAQAHFERVFDLAFPGSPLGLDTVDELSDVALRMADHDEAVQYFDILLPVTEDSQRLRSLLGRRGLARYKQGRHDEATQALHAALKGANPASGLYLPHLWILHVAYEEGGVSGPARRFPFRFRSDLARPGAETVLAFEDIAPRLGIDKLDGLGPSAWGDVDGDGDFDLYVSGADSYGALYRNDGDVFTDISVEAGLLNAPSGFSSTFVDYDNDGSPDLYVGRDGWNGPSRNSLYHNDGRAVFTEVTETAGVGHPGSSFVHAWTDYDRDGDLDLYVANGITGSGDTNVLYRNDGDGGFTDATAVAGLAEPSGTKTIGVAVGDYDKDGWPDIFVSGFATLNRLYHNKGDGTFEEVAAKAGVTDDRYISAGYVCFFVDYDNDTLPDILRTSLAPWHNVLIALSDRFEQLPPTEREKLLTVGPRLHRNNGDGTFTDMTFAVGLGNTGKGHGVTFIDLDGDGDLEIYAPEGGFWHGDPYPNALYLNKQTTGHHWLHVDLVGRESNRDAVGTRLTVVAGGRRVYREIYGGRGFGSSDSPTVEFGLGPATRVDRLELVWPSGKSQTFRDLPVDRRILIEEGGEIASPR
jgi:tetratricopeptide (TPR) repeat protein